VLLSTSEELTSELTKWVRAATLTTIALLAATHEVVHGEGLSVLLAQPC
jgi:hypothetical protein